MRYLLCLILAAVATTALTDESPDPGLNPAQVVQAQLAAFRGNNAQDQGIATAYRFASPRNKEAVGNLARFAQMIRTGYPDMLLHESAEIGDIRQRGEEAAVPVTLQLPDGTQTSYIFMLHKQTGKPCSDCWLTDGVVPLDAGEAGGPLRSI